MADDQRNPLGADSSELTTQQLNIVPPQDSSALTTQQLNVVGPATPVQQPPEGVGYPPPPPTIPFEAPKAPFEAPKAPQNRRRLLIIGLVVVVVLGGSGLTWALWPTKSKTPAAASPRHVVPGTLQSSILTPDDVSTTVGTTVITGSSVNQPPPALTADPASCAIAVGPATVSGYTKGWTVFYSTTYQDSGGTGDYTVTQTIGRYGDPGQSGAVFQALGQGVAACPSATRTDQNKNAVKWNYSVDANTPNQLAWTASQDAGGGWACYRQARLKGTAVLQVAICEGGDGKAAAAKVADAFEAKVSG